MHFSHVNLHFFKIFLSSHLPLFFSFLHLFVEILSLHFTFRIEFSSPEMYVSKTCGILRTRLNWELSESSHNEKKHYFKLLLFDDNKRTRKIWMNLDFEIDF